MPEGPPPSELVSVIAIGPGSLRGSANGASDVAEAASVGDAAGDPGAN